MQTTTALNDFFASAAQPPSMVAAKAQAKLAQYRSKAPGTLLRLGFRALDFFALLKGNYYLLAARPGVGKTAFLLQLIGTARAQLADNQVVLVFSAEMDSAALALREACAREKLPYWLAVTGELTPEQYDRLDARLARGMSLTYVDESPAPTVQHMVQQAMNLRASGKEIGLVLFDYLQLAEVIDVETSEKSRVDAISRGLAALAKELDCPVLALGQTNRSQEQGKPPTLASLMYGGEQQPSGVVVLDRPHLDNPAHEHHNLVDVWVIKHRHGPGGHCHLYYDGPTMRFTDVQFSLHELNGNETHAKAP